MEPQASPESPNQVPDTSSPQPSAQDQPAPETQPQRPSSAPAIPQPPAATFTPASAPAASPQAPASAGDQAVRPKRSFAILAITLVAVIIAVGAGSFATYAYLSSHAKVVAPNVKVGVLMAFTGGSSSMGYGEMKGIQLAQKQLNASNIQLVQMDSQCDPAIAPAAMQRLIDQQVVAVIGDGCSSASLAALPLADSAHIPMISPSASSPTLSIPNDFFFRVVPPDTYQGAFLAKAVYARGIKTVGIFYTNEPYGQNMNKVFTAEFTSLGGKVLTSVNAPSGVINLGTQIAAIRAANPQGIVFASNSVVTGAAAIELARGAGITAPFFGSDGLYDQTLINNAKTAAQGLTITTFPTGTPAFQQLLYTNDQGEQLYAAAQGYDAFEAVYDAVKAGAKTGDQIKNQLPHTSFNGVSAHIKFDANGDEDGMGYNYALLQVKDGSFVNAQ